MGSLSLGYKPVEVAQSRFVSVVTPQPYNNMQLRYLTLALFASTTSASLAAGRKTCTVKSSGTNQTDDAPAIRTAFKECGQHSKIVFAPTTYYVNSALDIRGLEDVDIDVQGELLVSHAQHFASL